ncbi:MAG: hypothetical protein JNK23_06105 [Opitutaceae bacterium]|nr:hypothetical protein [Opitutaceae bacterium]
MAEITRYRPSFSDLAAEFILRLTKRRQKQVMDRAHVLARDPWLESNCRIADASGRMLEHISDRWGGLFLLGRLSSRWVMIAEIEDAE